GACAKHFPGHGDTSVDSHVALPVAGEDPHARALDPFRAAIDSDVKAIMSAHIVGPTVDEAPATISRRIMTGMLRDELGFQGLAVSDGLEMRGLADDRSVMEAAVLALAAGCDALVIGGGLRDEATVLDISRAIAAAVGQGRLPEERLVQAASRVDALAAWRSSPLMGKYPAQPGDGVALEAARRADAVVVEMGVPAFRPRGASAYIATHGSARVCAQAAAELMTG